MDNTDFILLKAQFEALRTWTMIKCTENLTSRLKWKSKYFLCRLERENLPFADETHVSSLETKRIDRRRYELQWLLDISYVWGHLEEDDEWRYIDPLTLEKISCIDPKKDFDEETILYKLKDYIR